MPSRHLSQTIQRARCALYPKSVPSIARTWTHTRNNRYAHLHGSVRRQGTSGTQPANYLEGSKSDPTPFGTTSPAATLPPLSLPHGNRPSVIGDDELNRYVQPLYHRGWGICVSKIRPPRFVPVLSRTFKFRDDRALLDFVASIGQQTIEANHHPTITFTYNKLVMSLETHEAFLPDSSDGEATKTKGITLKDVHIAYQAEHIYDRLCEETGWICQYALRPITERPSSLHDLVALWGKFLEGSSSHDTEKVFVNAVQQYRKFAQYVS